MSGTAPADDPISPEREQALLEAILRLADGIAGRRGHRTIFSLFVGVHF